MKIIKIFKNYLGVIDWRLDPRLDKIRQNLKLGKNQTTYKISANSRKKLFHRQIYSTATNRSKSNGALFYNRIPKCGSSTAMKIMRKISWIGAPTKVELISKLAAPTQIFYLFPANI